MGLRAKGSGGRLPGLQEEEGLRWRGMAGTQHLDALATVDKLLDLISPFPSPCLPS